MRYFYGYNTQHKGASVAFLVSHCKATVYRFTDKEARDEWAALDRLHSVCTAGTAYRLMRGCPVVDCC